jgi:hypothetical protein
MNLTWESIILTGVSVVVGWLMGWLSSYFWYNKARKDQIMSNEGVRKVLRDSDPKDFMCNSSDGVYTFRQDVKLILKINWVETTPFQATWLKNLSDKTAEHFPLDIYYAQSKIISITFVHIDGGRCFMPLPTLPRHGLTITAFEYHLGLILNSFKVSEGLDSYLKDTGIRVTNL